MNNSNINNKTTTADNIKPYQIHYMHVIVYNITFLFVLTTNLMLIYGFYKTSRPFTIVTKLFICSSGYQIASALCYMVYSILVLLAPKGSITHFHFIIFFAFTYMILISEVLVFWTISYLRKMSIAKPMKLIKARTIYKILMIELITGFLAAIGIMIGYHSSNLTNQELFETNYKLMNGINSAMTWSSFSLNISSLTILRRLSNLEAQKNKGDDVSRNQLVIKRNRIALNTLLLITVACFVCSLPSTCLAYIQFDFLLQYNLETIMVICQCLQISGFGITSLIIISRTKNLREYYKLKFCCCFSITRVNNSKNHRFQTELTEI